jgi:hypothetical protein
MSAKPPAKRSRSAERSRRSSKKATRAISVAPLLDLETDALPLSVLDLDPSNPRLPESMQGKTQDELLAFIAGEYHALEIGRSIARHGYFPSEPLIVIKKQDRYTVLEGNRRLVALKLLADPDLASRLELPDAEEWSEIAGDAQLDANFPVVVAHSWREVAPIIGFRHISGIEPWDPWQKARFLAHLVDEENMGFEAAASEVGEDESDVRAHYRNYHVARQAKDDFRIDTTEIISRFGVFTRLLQDGRVLKYIGAPLPDAVRRGQRPLKAAASRRFKKVTRWVFGDAEKGPVFTDSRRITDFGRILASTDGIAVLDKTGDFEDAFAAAGGIRQRILHYLRRAVSALESAAEDIGTYVNDQEISAALVECERKWVALKAATR